ncbi:hypothetical protein ACMC56_00145 [Campylobacterota bacterium DY0563]
MNFFNDITDATNFKTASYEYQLSFKDLLFKIHNSYLNMKNKEFNLPKNENKIRDKLVDRYLSKEIKDYVFKKEEKSNLGRVDIYIIDKLDDSNPHFIIECKLLDNKNIDGVKGLNAEYVRNGIQRLITGYYKDTILTNAMIGFIVTNLDKEKNIQSINKLVEKILNGLIIINKEISLDEKIIYKSVYNTHFKEYIIFHLMMDFSKNV